MNVNTYELKTDEEEILFEFTSIGKKGKIKKVVQYVRISDSNYFNLGFGDWNEITGEIEDEVISNNGDLFRVLATVFSTLDVFFRWHPNAVVFLSGSTESRTRLYRIGIANNLSVLKSDFKLFGRQKGKFYPFMKNCDYDGFLITKKQ